MSRIKTAAWLLLGAALGLPAQGWCVQVNDDLGRPVALAHAAQRIVTLAPHTTELVLAAGGGDRLVGVAAGGNYPPSIGALPRIGGPGALDRERLLTLRPDLVIAWQSGNRASDLEWIERMGIALYRSEPTSLHDIASAIRAIGRLADKTLTAERAALRFEKSLVTPCAQQPLLPAYIEVWDRPAMTIGGSHWINDVLRHSGYRNMFGHVVRGVFAIADEARYSTRRAMRISLLPARAGDPDSRLADLLSRPTPGLAEAIELLCARRLGITGKTRP
ncbi:MAG: helical backbone metal receptor [Sedimenticolaceae bacterium]